MIGIESILISVVVTSTLFLLSKLGSTGNPGLWVFLAQTSGLFGSLFISWNFILALRTPFIEKFFGGLDKVYKIHNLLGNIAFVLIINHPLFLLINSLPVNTIKLYFVPSALNLSYAYGILAIYVLLILLIFTIFIDLPYNFWKKTHEFMGIVIILATLHTLFITSDVSRYLPLKIWMISWSTLALLAFLYKRFFYYILRKRDNYIVTEVIQEKNYLILSLTPVNPNKEIVFKPGQFAFFSINKRGREEHPFSILEQSGRKIKIGTKVIGSFTLEMTNLDTGDLVSVNGPYGFFGDPIKKAAELVYISGGIGITPFLSMIKAADGKPVTMIHTSHSNESNLFVNMFKNYSYYFPNFKFIHHLSDSLGHLNQNIIRGYTNLTSNTYVFLCGPAGMMGHLSDELPKAGVMKKRIIFEDFKLK